MGRYDDCPDWEYTHHPQRYAVLVRTCTEAALALQPKDIQLDFLTDTRQVHRLIFRELVPAGFEYYAGHYRGESFPCLENCEVGIRSDPRVGSPAARVAARMLGLDRAIRLSLRRLDLAAGHGDAPKIEKTKVTITVACRLFVEFLTIHPYLNGNGHVARLVLWVILARYGFDPERWTVEPRPQDPPYSDLIRIYRDGDRLPLETFVYRMLTTDAARLSSN